MASDPKSPNRFLRLTRNTLNRASFRTNQYKQVVQKKIDLGAIQKKIEQLLFELGKAVEEQFQAGQKDLLASKEVARLLEKVSSLKQAAMLLEEEIDLIRSESLEAAEEKSERDDNSAT